jgi:hypothetical protein
MKRLVQILTIASLIGLYSCCDVLCERHDYAEMLIAKVEKFKKENNRLPKEVSEIGLKEWEDSPAFYRFTNDTSYVVWYGLAVGSSKVFRSTTKKWTEEG